MFVWEPVGSQKPELLLLLLKAAAWLRPRRLILQKITALLLFYDCMYISILMKLIKVCINLLNQIQSCDAFTTVISLSCPTLMTQLANNPRNELYLCCFKNTHFVCLIILILKSIEYWVHMSFFCCLIIKIPIKMQLFNRMRKEVQVSRIFKPNPVEEADLVLKDKLHLHPSSEILISLCLFRSNCGDKLLWPVILYDLAFLGVQKENTIILIVA